MNEETALLTVLRSAMPPVGDTAPSRDLWPAVTNRRAVPSNAWLVDAVLAAAAAVLLFARPDWLLFLAYHL